MFVTHLLCYPHGWDQSPPPLPVFSCELSFCQREAYINHEVFKSDFCMVFYPGAVAKGYRLFLSVAGQRAKGQWGVDLGVRGGGLEEGG